LWLVLHYESPFIANRATWTLRDLRHSGARRGCSAAVSSNEYRHAWVSERVDIKPVPATTVVERRDKSARAPISWSPQVVGDNRMFGRRASAVPMIAILFVALVACTTGGRDVGQPSPPTTPTPPLTLATTEVVSPSVDTQLSQAQVPLFDAGAINAQPQPEWVNCSHADDDLTLIPLGASCSGSYPMPRIVFHAWHPGLQTSTATCLNAYLEYPSDLITAVDVPPDVLSTLQSRDFTNVGAATGKEPEYRYGTSLCMDQNGTTYLLNMTATSDVDYQTTLSTFWEVARSITGVWGPVRWDGVADQCGDGSLPDASTVAWRTQMVDIQLLPNASGAGRPLSCAYIGRSQSGNRMAIIVESNPDELDTARSARRDDTNRTWFVSDLPNLGAGAFKASASSISSDLSDEFDVYAPKPSYMAIADKNLTVRVGYLDDTVHPYTASNETQTAALVFSNLLYHRVI
jgi:hypothetical protein